MKKKIVWTGGVLVIAVGVFWIGSVLFESPQVSQGRSLFSYYCANCHGKKGRGDGPNAKYMDPRPRDLTDRAEEYMGPASNEEIFETLSRDIKEEEEVTDPDEFWIPAAMPTFKYTLSEEERWSLVAFVRTLHKHDFEKIDFEAPMETTLPIQSESVQTVSFNFPPEEREEMLKWGRHLYENKYVCLSCHQIGEEGGIMGPELDRAGFRLNPSWTYRWIRYPQSIKPKTKMPNFNITHKEAIAITLYLTTLRRNIEKASYRNFGEGFSMG
jgi:mono/diheme cytochrome c family protein